MFNIVSGQKTSTIDLVGSDSCFITIDAHRVYPFFNMPYPSADIVMHTTPVPTIKLIVTGIC